jgi:hypothetical protein
VEFTFDAQLWQWESRTDSWVFVSLPPEVSDEIADVGGGVTRGFGSLRVRVRLGASVWTTSIFPDRKRGAYVLPLKKAVRKGREVGDTATITVSLLDV